MQNLQSPDLSGKNPLTAAPSTILTEEGRETLHFFKNDISTAIQEDIDSFLKEKKL